MPCEPFTSKDGKVTGWICSRTKPKPQTCTKASDLLQSLRPATKPQTCYKCGKPSTRLCDFRDYRDGTAALDTCDRPMCDDCANNAGPELDFCDEHFSEFHMGKTRLAEKEHQERLARMDRERGGNE